MEEKNFKGVPIANISFFLKSIVSFIFSKWLLIGLVCIIAGLGGVLYAWLKDPIYTAEMVFASENERSSGIGSYSGIAAQFGIDIGGGSATAFQGDNLIEFLQTRTIVEKTLLSPYKNKLLIDDYLVNHKIKKKIDGDPILSKVFFEANPSTANRVRDSIMSDVYKRVSTKQLLVDKLDKRLSFVVIKMEDNNEEFAKKFVELLAENTIKYYTEYKTKKAKQNFDILKQQTDSIRNILFGNLETIAENNDLNVNPLKQKAKTTSQKTQINSTANAALYTELQKQLGLAQVNLQRETPLIQIIDKPVLPLKKIKPGRLLTAIIFSFVAGFLTIMILVVKKAMARLSINETNIGTAV